MEVALVFVLGIETGVGVGADEITSGDRRLEQRDVVDVCTGRLCCIEDVRHVYEDGDVFAHERLLGLSVAPALSGCSATTGLFSEQPEPYPRLQCDKCELPPPRSRGAASTRVARRSSPT